MKNKIQNTSEVLAAYADYERQIAVQHLKLGCYLVMTLMPVGFVLDLFVYPGKLIYFFLLRLACALLAALIWIALRTPFGKRNHWGLSLLIALLPTFFICWMIYATDGFGSPYYAGLNLVLLAIALVMRWTVALSVTASFCVIVMYLAACFLHGTNVPGSYGDFVNNLYFLALTAIIVIAGGRLHRDLRIREFTLRYQLDKNRKELEETNRKLVELDRLKSKFFANISHELRTPLTLLLAPLETLRQRFSQSFDEDARQMLDTMHGNGMRLLKLINDLLELIRVESGRMDIKHDTVVVADFLKGLASAVRQVAENKHIKLETEVDESLGAVVADRDKLEKIVLNLLFNAVKFTPADGKVTLRAEKRIASGETDRASAPGAAAATNQNQAPPDNGSQARSAAPENGRAPQREELVISVSDTGVGIARQNLPFVFDRFWQGDNSAKRKFSGVGIGLALVKELAEILNGTVAVESEEGLGATFTVRLPYQKVSDVEPLKRSIVKSETGSTLQRATASTKPDDEWLANLYRRAELFPTVAVARGPARPPDLGGRRPVALIAEDEPDMQRYLKTELQRDYDIVQAWDGIQALEKAQQFLPDIILLDMMMPEIDGLEVCRELRRREATQNIPVILLTARADEETKYDALKIGANDFLAKPFSSTELQARIKNLIESHHYQRKLSKQNVALTSAIEQIKETELQLVQSEKLASLGRLSAGIIHEINNPLNYTLTGLFALRHKGKLLAPEQRGEYDEILNDVEEGLKRVQNIVTDLRTFTHPGSGATETVEVSDAVEAALRFLAGEWKGKVRVEQNLPPGQTVWANRNQLIHVLVNLAQNAMDALAEKKFAGGDEPTLWIEGRVEDNHSFIVVRDNGTGIDPKLLDKIFDPFFTTKEVGKGMGLGLSICYRILQGYGGKISVKSERGKFCEFTVELPLQEPKDEAPQQETLALK